MSYISDYKAGAMSDDEYKYNSNRDRDEMTECSGQMDANSMSVKRLEGEK